MNRIEVTRENRDTVIKRLRTRGASSNLEEEAVVRGILERVRAEGDEAVLAYTAQFDGRTMTAADMEVGEEEIRRAYELIDPTLPPILQRAGENIRAFHEKQRTNSWFTTADDGSLLGMRVLPMDAVGVYVPGGKAAYPSSVLMNVLPAKVAGVPEVIMVTPCDAEGAIDPAVLVAAKEAGVDRIFRIGGAQAIAALAYGTETIPKVDKIVGPGNIYVALAKKAVFGEVSIDSVAGPSEVLVLADETADPSYVAADLLSQAEHDEMASSVLVTDSVALADAVEAEIERMIPTLSRAEILRASWNDHGAILIAEKEDAIALTNAFAPEHLEIQMRDPWDVMTRIRHAGAVFLGPYSSEPLGDYYAGPNHVLPTGGTARFFSPLNVEDFIKRSSVISYSREGLEAVHTDIETFARQEGLTAHAQSIAVRFESKKEA